MSSIYQRALGSDFYRLHPEIQRRFGFSSSDCIASVGRGVMDEVWRGPFYTVPFLYVGTWRQIMFPEVGRNIPFTIENYAFVDRFGRETVTWVRTFESTRRRRFDAYMIFSEKRGRIVDYLGSHEHLAVDIELSVTPEGGLGLRSGSSAILRGSRCVSFPDALQRCRRSSRMVRRRCRCSTLWLTCGIKPGVACSVIAARSPLTGYRSNKGMCLRTYFPNARSTRMKNDRDRYVCGSPVQTTGDFGRSSTTSRKTSGRA